MPSPRFFLLTSVAMLTFGPGLLAPSLAAGPQHRQQADSVAAARSRPLIVAQNNTDSDNQDGLPDQPAPPKPYKSLSVKLPKTATESGFEAFRKQLADSASRKDKEALAKLIGAKIFHLGVEGTDKADKDKSGIDYLSELLDLDNAESFGWEALAGAARDPTADPLPQQKGVICGPGAPSYDKKAFEVLLQDTDTDEFEWAYAAAPVEVRESDKPDAPVIEKVNSILLRILPVSGQDGEDGGGAQSDKKSDAIAVVVPSGKTGYVASGALRPLSTDQLCYAKDADSWKIVGYVGAE